MAVRTVNKVSLVSSDTLGAFWARDSCATSPNKAAKHVLRSLQPRKSLQQAVRYESYVVSLRGSEQRVNKGSP